MLENILIYLNTLDIAWIYIILFVFAFIENPFPPSPSDVVVVLGATLISHSPAGFIPVLIITSLGSSLGFLLMYYIGFYFSEKLIRSHKFKFISDDAVQKADVWFRKYGYKLILANRFLPGTRSIISFFSGVSELQVKKTFILATISAFAWNILLITLGMLVGKNVEIIDQYLSTYSNIILTATAVILLAWLIKLLYQKIIKKRQLS